jgi:hypothetical protein
MAAGPATSLGKSIEKLAGAVGQLPAARTRAVLLRMGLLLHCWRLGVTCVRSSETVSLGDVAQLARAPALQAGSRGFESHRLHAKVLVSGSLLRDHRRFGHVPVATAWLLDSSREVQSEAMTSGYAAEALSCRQGVDVLASSGRIRGLAGGLPRHGGSGLAHLGSRYSIAPAHSG